RRSNASARSRSCSGRGCDRAAAAPPARSCSHPSRRTLGLWRGADKPSRASPASSASLAAPDFPRSPAPGRQRSRRAERPPSRAERKTAKPKAFAPLSNPSPLSCRSALEHERDLVAYARHLDRLTVDDPRLVLEFRGRIHRRLVEDRVRRLDDANVFRRARSRDRELHDHVSLETALRRTLRINRLDFDDRKILAIAHADAEPADLHAGRAELRRRDRDRETRIEVRERWRVSSD